MSAIVKKSLSLLLAFLMIFTLITPTYALTAATDISGHWAQAQLEKWIANGIISGYGDGTVKPNNNITRAEFVVLLNKVCKYVDASSTKFTDVDSGAWYADAVSKAYEAGAVSGYGNGLFKPQASISREEAAVIFVKAFNLEAQDKNFSSKFKDSGKIESWSKAALSAMAEKGYMVGNGGNLIAPKDKLTRAQFVTILDKIAGDLKSMAGTYTGNTKGSLVVNTRDVVLKDMTVNGDLFLMQGIGNGNVTLDNVTVKGRTVVRGGGENSIVIKNSSLAGTLLVIKADGKVRIVAQGSTEINNVRLNSGAKLQEDGVTGEGFRSVEVLQTISAGQAVTLDGDFESVSIEAPQANVDVIGGTVGTLTVASNATGANINLGIDATVTTLTVNAGLNVTGQGSIETAKIISPGVVIAQTPKNIEIAANIDANIGGKTVSKDNTGTVSQGAGASGSAGSSGSSSSSGSSGTSGSNPPAPPTGLAACLSTYNSVDLSWMPVSGATGYNVYRSTSSNGTYTKVNVADLTDTAFSDTVLNPDTTYYYKVAAVNANGNSSMTEAASISIPAAAAPGDWKLVWSDNFNRTPGTGVDVNKWTYEIGGNGFGNNELQYCTNRTDNVFIKQDPNDPNNRLLTLQALKEDYEGKQYTSGRIKTSGKFDFTYGKVEMRAKLPFGKGIGCSFWMLGSNFATVGWPDCGEIDIMENNGLNPDRAYGTIHGPGYSAGNSIGTWHENPAGYADNYHTYSIEWEPNVIRWYVDGQLYEERTPEDLFGKQWVYDHSFYIILGLGVGGNWPGNPDASTVFPQQYDIDYVHVYQREGGVYPEAQYRNLVQIKNVGNNKYACTDKQNGDYLYGNRSSAGAWETFEKQDLGDGKIALLSLTNYKYVSASAGDSKLIASKETIGDSETFSVVDNIDDGTKSLMCLSNGKYVTVPSSGIMEATASTIGNSEKFIFYSAPEAPTGLSVISSTNYSIHLAWKAAHGATSYNVYRSASSSGPYIKINTSAIFETSYTNTGLTAGNTYYYKVTAVNTNGESQKSAALSATTPTELTPPAAPTGLFINSSTASTIDLTWSQVEGATGYNLYRSATAGGQYDKITPNPLSTAEFRDSALTVATAYYYKITAVNEAGESEPSDYLFGTTAGFGTGTKSYSYIIAKANSRIVHADTSDSSGKLPLRASAGDASTDSELFELIYNADGTVGLASKALNKLVCADTYFVSDEELLPRSNYSTSSSGWEAYTLEPQGDGTVAIKTHNTGTYVTVVPDTFILKGGSATVGENEKFIIVTPNAPGQPSITVDTHLYNSVSFHWTSPASSIIAGYDVYRADTVAGPYTKLNTSLLTTSAFTDTSVVPGTTYYYKVGAVNARGTTLSAEASVTTYNGPLASVPSGLDISSTTSGSIALCWTPVAGATSYNVYRSSSRFGTYTKINADPVTSSGYTDSGLTNTNYYYSVTTVNENGETEFSSPVSMEMKLFGPNVYVFDPNDKASEVQAIATNLFKQQEANQFGTQRYALLFKPGAYSTDVKVGFYTQVAGLGKIPDDTSLNSLTVDANWMANNNATCNFWRSAENLAVNSNTTWAVSQAAPLRRVHIKGKLSLFVGSGYSSGGFLADSLIDGQVVSGSQQQWFTRNTNLAGGWSGGVWNMVFVGNNNPPAGTWPDTKNTTVTQTPVIREKPFLYIDDSGNYNVFVPALRTDSIGPSWSTGNMGAGTSYSIDDFYIAHPETDTAATINAALSQGKNLLFTPGIYHINQTIRVTRDDTVVLGLGLASLMADDGVTIMSIDDISGVKLAGILFDAGPETSPTLLQVGPENNPSPADHSGDPTVISDIVVRVGGPSLANAVSGLEINSNNVIGDDFWVWRADHGVGAGWNSGSWSQSTWYTDTCTNGMIVNGDYVTMYGLMVEHFQEYQTVWNGEGGRTYFYQSEMPYDIPDQASWMSHGGTVNGFSSYKVSDSVTSHEAWGLGIYSYFRDAVVKANSAMEVPNNPGVIVHNVCSVFLTGNGEITHVINNTGATAKLGSVRQEVTLYSNNVDQPIIALAPGAYLGPQTVVITCPDQAATIKYTIDGSIPSATNGNVYTDPFVVSYGSTTVKAIAIKEGMADSGIAAATYTITDNIALGKSASASSTQASTTNTPDKAFDGDPKNTRWESTQGVDPQWLCVDLGQSYSISGVRIIWQNAAGKDYTIQVSDDNNSWTDVYTVTGGSAGATLDVSLPDVQGRYVRMYGTARTGSYGYSIFEFEVYTNKVATPDITPTTGTYNSDQTVSITCLTPGAEIRYTTDGSTPTATTGTVYTEPFTVSGLGVTTIKAKAFKAGMLDSNERSSIITITDNLALNKTAIASTSHSTSNIPNKAFDGDANTRWESDYSDPQWIMVDLGASYSISNVNITWYSGSTYAKDFKIQVSNDDASWTDANYSAWTDAYLVTGLSLSSPYKSDFNISTPVTGRYLRIYGTQRKGTYGYSIKEVVVKGIPAP